MKPRKPTTRAISGAMKLYASAKPVKTMGNLPSMSEIERDLALYKNATKPPKDKKNG